MINEPIKSCGNYFKSSVLFVFSYHIIFILSFITLVSSGCSTDEIIDTNDTLAKRNVRIAEVQRKHIIAGITTIGIIESDINLNLSPSIGGIVTDIHVREGEIVIQDQLLLEIEDFQLTQIKEHFINIEKNYKRFKELLKTDSIDKQSFEEIEAGYNIAKSNYNNALKNTMIKSPIDGQVSRIALKQGETYNPMTYPYLLRLLSLDKMSLISHLSDCNYNQVHEGMSVKISVPTYPDSLFKGKVISISPEADILSGKFRCKIVIEDSSNLLRHNQFARIFIITKESENTLTVPQKAILNDEIIFVYDDGKARRKVVETGIYNNDEIEIIDGLSEHDKVIIEGNVGLTDNYPINIIN